jgi:hypothetical protein
VSAEKYLEAQILPELRVVQRGRRILVLMSVLERWLDRPAAVPLQAGRRPAACGDDRPAGPGFSRPRRLELGQIALRVHEGTWRSGHCSTTRSRRVTSA